MNYKNNSLKNEKSFRKLFYIKEYYITKYEK